MSPNVRSSNETPGVAFVTGGARGLGNAVAASFAKEGARAVVIVDIGDATKGKQIVESFGAEVLVINADITKEAEVERAIAETVAKFGRLDYAANFAGVIGPQAFIMDAPLDQYERAMGVNATGLFLCTKHQIRQMIKQDSLEVESGRVPQKGSIVNCASVNSILSGPAAGVYTASKHAVMGITKAAALEARSYGIRVNAVSPGFLYTDMVGAQIEKSGDIGRAGWDAVVARQGRVATFEEIGDAAVMLSSPKMSLVNGHNLLCDNGFSVNETQY